MNNERSTAQSFKKTIYFVNDKILINNFDMKYDMSVYIQSMSNRQYSWTLEKIQDNKGRQWVIIQLFNLH